MHMSSSWSDLSPHMMPTSMEIDAHGIVGASFPYVYVFVHIRASDAMAGLHVPNFSSLVTHDNIFIVHF